MVQDVLKDWIIQQIMQKHAAILKLKSDGVLKNRAHPAKKPH